MYKILVAIVGVSIVLLYLTAMSFLGIFLANKIGFQNLAAAALLNIFVYVFFSHRILTVISRKK